VQDAGEHRRHAVEDRVHPRPHRETSEQPDAPGPISFWPQCFDQRQERQQSDERNLESSRCPRAEGRARRAHEQPQTKPQRQRNATHADLSEAQRELERAHECPGGSEQNQRVQPEHVQAEMILGKAWQPVKRRHRKHPQGRAEPLHFWRVRKPAQTFALGKGASKICGDVGVIRDAPGDAERWLQLVREQQLCREKEPHAPEDDPADAPVAARQPCWLELTQVHCRPNRRVLFLA
jgi:hypothetical protein